MARTRSANVPVARRSAARETSTAAWAIIPGNTSPTLIVSSATATKMSSRTVTMSTLPATTEFDREQVAGAVEHEHQEHRARQLDMQACGHAGQASAAPIVNLRQAYRADPE